MSGKNPGSGRWQVRNVVDSMCAVTHVITFTERQQIMQMAAKKIELERRVRALRVRGDEVRLSVLEIETHADMDISESTKTRLHTNTPGIVAGLQRRSGESAGCHSRSSTRE